MESIISSQKISRRRTPGAGAQPRGRAAPAKGEKGRPEQAGALGLSDPGYRRSALLTSRLPSAKTPSDFVFLKGPERSIEFRQLPSARRQGRQKADPTPRQPRYRSRSGRGLLGVLRGLVVGLRERGARLLPRLGKALFGLSPRGRLAALLALALIVAALFIGHALLYPLLPLPQGSLLPEDGANEDLLLAYVTPEMNGDAAGGDGLSLPPPPAMLELRSYTVRRGDSLGSVAKRFGIAIDTLVSMNGISNARAFRLGTELRIPNMNGLLYRVRAGDSLSSIAKLYKIDSTRIADANDLGSAVLKVGQSLFIPGARLPEAELKRIFGEKVLWPLRGPISSWFGYRPDPFTGVRSFHAGIDIAVDPGTRVRAAMDGKVADVGYNPTYGNYVILSHAGGIQTLYGHLTSYSVRIGQTVSQGDYIALTGSTGYSTGPHLHFGLYHHGNPVDPLKYLK